MVITVIISLAPTLLAIVIMVITVIISLLLWLADSNNGYNSNNLTITLSSRVRGNSEIITVIISLAPHSV